MPKLIDAEAAKAALRCLLSQPIGCRYTDIHYGTIESVLHALDALPDASERFFDYIEKESHRTGKSPQQVFAAEWEAFVKLKDDSLWPDVSDGGQNDIARMTEDGEYQCDLAAQPQEGE